MEIQQLGQLIETKLLIEYASVIQMQYIEINYLFVLFMISD